MRIASKTRIMFEALLLVAFVTASAFAAFDCGSNGSDGVLTFENPETPTIIDFDPWGLGIDNDRDGIYHFTDVNIPANVTLRCRASLRLIGTNNRASWSPLIWLCQGDVNIEGTIDLSGQDSFQNSPSNGNFSIPGQGGFPGAINGMEGLYGFGPGVKTDNGQHPGNIFLYPLYGGSGGKVSSTSTYSGGAGGGAILLASNSKINLIGKIDAHGGSSNIYSYGGAGGAIHLISPEISGGGIVDLCFDGIYTGNINGGWFRMEAYIDSFTGTIKCSSEQTRRVTLVPLAAENHINRLINLKTNTILARVAKVNGVDMPTTPTGSFTIPDGIINTNEPVLFEFIANGVTPGKKITVFLYNENSGPIQFISTSLEGTIEQSTATATQKVEYGLNSGLLMISD